MSKKVPQSLEIEQSEGLVKGYPSDGNQQQDQKKDDGIAPQKKTSPLQILFALLACLFYSASSILRIYQGDNVNFSNMLVTLSLLVTSIVYFGLKITKSRMKGEIFKFPWQHAETLSSSNQIVSRYDKIMLIQLFIGGVLEFVGNELMIVAFKNIQIANMNNGIVQALLTSAVIIVIIGSYFLFNEKTKPLQFLGIALLISAVCIVSVFRDSPFDLQLDSSQQEDHSVHSMIAIVIAIISAQCFGVQCLIFKHVIKKPVSPPDCGFTFLFFCGVCGFMSLIYEIIFDSEQFGRETLSQYLITYIIGLVIGLGIVFTNVSAGLGLAGISFSIINLATIVVSVFNQIVFGQNLNAKQYIGVVLAVVGAIIVSIADLVKCGPQQKQQK